MSMWMRWMFLGLLLVVCTVAGGQEWNGRQLSVVGVVWDKDSLQPLSGAVCHQGDISKGVDEKGCFSVRVQVGDTLRFSHVGYVPAEVVITDSLAGDDYLLGVFLSRDTVMLAEVLILPRFLDRRIRLNPLLQNAHQNLRGALWAASRPVEKMDREMNQKMMIEDFARQVEMKGMVDVQLGVGLHSLQAWRALRNSSKQNNERMVITPRELDLLRRVFNAEKKEKMNN